MITAADQKIIRQIFREELAANRQGENTYSDQAYLVATTTPQERNRMARKQWAAQKEAK